MHILFLTENFPPEMNAAATRVYERACYWVKWGHKVTVVTCAPNFPQGHLFDGYKNKWYQTEMMDGIRVVRVKSYIAPNSGVMKRILDFLSFMVMGFVGGLFQRKADVIVGNSPQFFTAVAAYALSVVKWKPFVFELADLWPASIAGVGAMKAGLGLRMMEKVELFLYRRAKAVIALTQAFKNDLISRGINPDKIAVVINGVDLTRYSPQEKDDVLAQEWGLKDKFVAGYIGTHGMAHALDNILDAAELVKENDAIRFMLVGAGACRDTLVEECKTRGLTNVVMVPPQPKDRMPAFWSLCDVALIHLKNIPLFETVLPSKMFEAMGMGLPLLLALPQGEASAIVEKENAGVWVPGQDPRALADAVERMTLDNEFYQALKKNSYDAAPRYSREKQATDMLQVLDNVWVGQPPLFVSTAEESGFEDTPKLNGGVSVCDITERGTVLVTGASGFVGRHVCKALIDDGFSVRAIIRNPAKTELIPSKCDVRIMEQELDGNTDWAELLDGVDYVVHLAAQVHRLKGDEVIGYRTANVDGTRRLAVSSAEAGVKRFVFLSSIKASGETTSDQPFGNCSESHPEDAYGHSKLDAEKTLAEICATVGHMQWCALRPPLVYGPGVKANFLRLLTLVDKGVPIPMGSITNLRSFVGVRNLTDAVMCCVKHPAAVNKAYVVCDGQDLSTAELIRRIGVLEQRSARLIPVPVSLLKLMGMICGRSKEVDRLVGTLAINMHEIKNELGWTPPFSFEQELAFTVCWYRARWYRGRKKYRGAGA